VIAIIDYGMGNLRSVQKGFAKIGHEAQIVSSARELAEASHVVLPGVGAFQHAIEQLDQRGLVEPVQQAVAAGKPFLGICLGLQLLFDRSLEDGVHAGLGIVPGEIRRFELPTEYKVPHMGWNEIAPQQPAPLWAGLAMPTHVYFVHSYYAVPQDSSMIAATADYGGPFAAAIWRDNLFATQFHPEKSQDAGLRMLKNFAERS
jgi:glutamine amidotransferase